MAFGVPVAELNTQFSSPGATALPWREAEQYLQQAEVFWLSSVRPNARPHVAPVIAVWLDGALYFCTGADERKAKNLAHNPQVVISTGRNALAESLDLVIEGEAVAVSEEAQRSKVADALAAKYGDGWRLPGIEGVVVFAVTPTTAFGFGRGDGKGPPPQGGFNQTRWRFQDCPAATSRS